MKLGTGMLKSLALKDCCTGAGRVDVVVIDMIFLKRKIILPEWVPSWAKSIHLRPGLDEGPIYVRIRLRVCVTQFLLYNKTRKEQKNVIKKCLHNMSYQNSCTSY